MLNILEGIAGFLQKASLNNLSAGSVVVQQWTHRICHAFVPRQSLWQLGPKHSWPGSGPNPAQIQGHP